MSTWSFIFLFPSWEVKMAVRGEAVAQWDSAGTKLGCQGSVASPPGGLGLG